MTGARRQFAAQRLHPFLLARMVGLLGLGAVLGIGGNGQHVKGGDASAAVLGKQRRQSHGCGAGFREIHANDDVFKLQLTGLKGAIGDQHRTAGAADHAVCRAAQKARGYRRLLRTGRARMGTHDDQVAVEFQGRTEYDFPGDAPNNPDILGMKEWEMGRIKVVQTPGFCF